ncbi:cystathionine gamma-synthase [Roseivirga sp. E12]|uniref:cystathionine gamma-synthase n=1 Tax=Roseivirga sp. E12 TaxID=2819237 RepID=UPI001ABC058C|nr:cystathionine gamma-synthase [Roseivirga sp. E12]MBO3700458.1 cystathionine gamma-synthase [Roseivirga sp. E12]
MHFDTKAVHAGVEPDPSTGAIMTPIFQTSTYVQKSPGDHQGFEYARSQNPTRSALQKSIAMLENANYGLVFGSGVAAIDAVVKLLKPGDEVISGNDLYGGTYRIFTKIFEGFGIKFHFVDMNDAAGVEQYVNENTKLIWLETPTNPMMSIIDIKAISAISKKHSLLLGVDNTFASPVLQSPMELGADIVMHSVTKYLGGHSDVVMGAIAVNDESLYKRLAFIQNSCGAVPGPQDCFLVLRGIKTLHLRMERHCENGEKVARFLAQHPEVDKVYWPGFESHPNHEIAKEQMKGFGGMISFTFHEDDMQRSFKVMEKFKLFALAESLGGVESMANHPATMTHGAIPKEERMKVGLLDSLIRLSVGIENADDLIADLEQAIG